MLSETKKILSVENVTIGYEAYPILENISFEVRLGEFVYIVGKTGAGKSTLMKLIYADHLPSKGKVEVGDFTPSHIHKKDIPYLRRKLGIVFQDFQLLPSMTASENIDFALRASGWKEVTKIKNRIQEVLNRVGLSEKGASYPHQLSGGEQQRVAIARSLINDPMILIADEPTGNLDPEATDNIMEVLQKINISGTAVLMATHEHSLLKRFPSRVLHVANRTIVDYHNSEDFIREMYGV